MTRVLTLEAHTRTRARSLEMLESVCLICATLLEVPSMAANPLNPKKRIISKSFHRILDMYGRQVGAERVGVSMGVGRGRGCF